MADNTLRGRFVWHELMTPEEAGAHEFYSKVLGWKTRPWEQDPSYSLFAAASGPLGGSVAHATGTPQWLTYIGTDDIDATVERAQALGGRVVEEIKGMPNGGRYARLADPQGAVFGVYSSASEPGEETSPQRGEFSWHELAAEDYQAAFEFYRELFGWERIDEHDMGPLGHYLIFGRDGAPKGGMFDKPAEMAGPPAWLGYVRVKDVEHAVRKVKAARGTLINGPMEVPGGDWIAQFLDPYGAMFAVHAVAADVKSAAGAGARAQRREQVESGEADGGSRRQALGQAGAAKSASAAEKASAKQAPARKAAGKKSAAKKAAGKKAAEKKAAGKKAAGKTAAARKAAGKKAPAKKKTPARKASARKKGPARKAPAKKRRAGQAARRAGARKQAAVKRRSARGGRAATKRGGARGKTAARRTPPARAGRARRAK